MRSLLSNTARTVLAARSVVVAKRVPAFINLTARNFAVTKSGDERPALDEVLSQEIAHETANMEVDQEYLDIKKSVQKNFELKEKQGSSFVELVRKHKDETITVQFDVQNEVEDENEVDDYSDEDQNPDEYDENGQNGESGAVNYGIRFDVNVAKGENTLVFDCLAGETFKIVSIQHVVGDNLKDEKNYFGPAFHDLEPSLQESFYDFLNERKIDDDLSFFVLSHSRAKEQNEYVHWLKKILEFSAK